MFGLLERKQFAACLFRWTQALHEATGGKLIAIDGKTLRRSLARKGGKTALHLVTAWCTQNGLTLGQVLCQEKSNEITAVPELLQLLNVQDCTVTVDAMGCQKEIAAQIRAQKGHYLLALKGNQSSLHDDMQRLCQQALDEDLAGPGQDRHATEETGHGRRESRSCYVVEIPRRHRQRQAWKDLRTLVIVTCGRRVGSTESWETRLYVSSHPPHAQQLALAVRRFAVSLLRQDTTIKRGMKSKRLNCALDPNYLLRVLQSSSF